jgi:N-acylglucosamine 2-epimerase/mannose-6-phosphate isomerase
MPDTPINGWIERARVWCFDAALPLWLKAGLNQKDGGVIEALTFDGTDAKLDYVRTRVLGRQLYVFSQASLLGFAAGRAAADHIYAFLTAHAWHGPQIGWVRRLSRSGEPLDATPDLYDLAFVLFGLAWYARAGGPPAVWDWIERTLDLLDSAYAHPSKLGFLHEAPPKGPRPQNPHMHLLEAALAGLGAAPHPRLHALATHLVDLCRERLFDARTKTLAEFFADDWTRVPGDAGRITEPGHHFEWTWILIQAQRLMGLDLSAEARALFGFAERFGVDHASGVVFAQVRDDGVALDRGTRTWQTTERIKAHLAMFEAFGCNPRADLDLSLRRLFEVNFATKPPGLWLDAHNATGTPVAPNVPASTFYHVFVALTELLRLAPALRALPPG